MFGLSATLLSKVFEKTIFYCDDISKKIFIDELNFPFSEVRNSLRDIVPDKLKGPLWAMGKVKAYELTREPFIHIDQDVFLFKHLPQDLLYKDIVSESSTSFFLDSKIRNEGAYQPDYYKEKLKWVPKDLLENFDKKFHKIGCFGIFGGNDFNSINKSSRISLEIANNPDNLLAIQDFEKDGICASSSFEEYFLSSYLSILNKDITFLLNSKKKNREDDDLGYHHLIGMNKKNPFKQLGFRKKLLEINPSLYKRIQSFSNKNKLIYS